MTPYEIVREACAKTNPEAEDYLDRPSVLKGYLWDARREELCARDNGEVL